MATPTGRVARSYPDKLQPMWGRMVSCGRFATGGTEQSEIVAALDHEAARIDATIARAREQIAKFQKYRTAPISAAVTGKIDVRGSSAESAGFDKCSQIDEH